MGITDPEAGITLKKRTDMRTRFSINPILAGVLLIAVAPVLAMSQETSPSVKSNISEGAGASARKAEPAEAEPLVAVPEGFESLQLGPGFLLQMDVFGVPEMSMQLRVDGRGNITVPLIGPVSVEGDTVPEAEQQVARAFVKQEILKDPQVTLRILQFAARNVSVLGEVQSPGRVQLLAPESLSKVLALAGGESLAAGSDIELQHPDPDGKLSTQHVHYVPGKNPSVLENVLVAPGDTVFVHKAGIIYVLGAVNRPGGYLMVNGGALNVVQAVALASGETLQASTRWAIVVRRKGDSFTQFKVPLKKMETGGATPVELEFNDILYVPVSGWKVALTSGSGIISTAVSATIYKAP